MKLITLEGYNNFLEDGAAVGLGFSFTKTIKKVGKAAGKVGKIAMKTAAIVAPVAGAALGIPPAVTSGALTAVSNLSKSGNLTKKAIKEIAKKAGTTPDKLIVATALIKANSAEQRAAAVKEIAKKSPDAGKTAAKLAADLNSTENVIQEKLAAREEQAAATQEENENSIARQYYRAGIVS